MTDSQPPNSTYHDSIQTEQEQYGDLRFQDLEGGIQFGVRYLNHILFSFFNYDFDYMLRMDDDYFFCIDQFLSELPVPMESMFHWGWTHCITYAVRPEESMLLFSRDLLMHFLLQDPYQLKCHPWADQMIGAWAEDLKLRKIFRHDPRLHHTPIISKEPTLRTERNICQKYMGVHGCYAEDMLLLWHNRGDHLTVDKNSKRNLKSSSKLCKDVSVFKWEEFIWRWRYKAKPCILKPSWNTTKQTLAGGAYTGRGELLEDLDDQYFEFKKFAFLFLLVTCFVFAAAFIRYANCRRKL